MIEILIQIKAPPTLINIYIIIPRGAAFHVDKIN